MAPDSRSEQTFCPLGRCPVAGPHDVRDALDDFQRCQTPRVTTVPKSERVVAHRTHVRFYRGRTAFARSRDTWVVRDVRISTMTSRRSCATKILLTIGQPPSMRNGRPDATLELILNYRRKARISPTLPLAWLTPPGPGLIQPYNYWMLAALAEGFHPFIEPIAHRSPRFPSRLRLQV